MAIIEHVEAWLRSNREEAVAWRRHIHAHPETADEEFATTAFIAQILREHGLKPQLLANTGLIVDIGPKTDELLAFRADIDALRIPEATGLDFSSKIPGLSHSCGHDIHTTIALSLACALSEAPLKTGVRIIFQPAEEILTGGAVDLIAQGVLEKVAVLYAIHVEPKLKIGRIGVRTGAITSAADLVKVVVNGEGGHSSRPHLTHDVVFALSSVVTQLPGLLSRRVDPRSGTVAVFGHISAGDAPNAIPQHGEILGTVRTADISVWRRLETLLPELISSIVAPTGCAVEVFYTRGVPPVVNDDVATALLAEAGTYLGSHAVVEAPQSAGGEDFSWYLEHVPGSMARLGAWSGIGAKQDLHMGDLVLDERAIDAGLRLFGSVVEKFHQRLQQSAELG
ncbi:amidohydrolase [Corynebacterium caspium]|uniref:amidohydrolase n=1 Tax=Corynebacterium caspium TaxID=234828 RepID=UPI0003614EA7|nr:amidohydrolase [Corynebacterium caspium]WKD59753.1 putative hydrolase YxeP [Corynebacterium caspium DSM 44850]